MGEQKHRIALLTDSTCDIPPDYVKQYDIFVVSQYVIWGTEELRDMIDIDPRSFYERLVKEPVSPKTSQPVVSDFVRTLERARDEGAEEAVIIVISNQLSGTILSARQAKEMVDIPVHVVDSLSTSMGLGWQVLAAARAREAGGDAQAMIAAADKTRQTMQVIFSVDTLEYLHRGGRIGGAAKLVGTALQLKPQLYVDHATGRVEPGERTRTRKKALKRVYEVFFENMDTSKPMHIAVLHSAAEEEATGIYERIREEYEPVELLMGNVTPVIGTHTGPGAIGIVGYYET
ncbi:MAG TPA: DegV family protein [Chloroflexi bacterium]|nr:DegV family protein [Chloroflexota bacterium]